MNGLFSWQSHWIKDQVRRNFSLSCKRDSLLCRRHFSWSSPERRTAESCIDNDWRFELKYWRSVDCIDQSRRERINDGRKAEDETRSVMDGCKKEGTKWYEVSNINSNVPLFHDQPLATYLRRYHFVNEVINRVIGYAVTTVKWALFDSVLHVALVLTGRL